MAKNEGKPSWFKMFSNQKALIDAVSDEVAGRALKAAFSYFDDRANIPELDQITFAVFATIKPYIDESYADYQNSVDAGAKGAKVRWGSR